ncbi:hypothetical protein [Shimia sp. SDUM112013]|uniref:hypothetical protein n=1 Tax=Shimia sp. SDUM112013 TaxID=3136160 RepID=UPI0032EBA14C
MSKMPIRALLRHGPHPALAPRVILGSDCLPLVTPVCSGFFGAAHAAEGSDGYMWPVLPTVKRESRALRQEKHWYRVAVFG